MRTGWLALRLSALERSVTAAVLPSSAVYWAKFLPMPLSAPRSMQVRTKRLTLVMYTRVDSICSSDVPGVPPTVTLHAVGPAAKPFTQAA